MKGYYIEVTNNLLDPKHRKAIGAAIWEFLWCLDKMTSISEDGVGLVLGGKPIKSEEISEYLGKDRSDIGKNLRKLERSGYISLNRTSYGNVIKVNKAKKRFGQKGKNPSSKEGKKGKNPSSRRAKTPHLVGKNPSSDGQKSPIQRRQDRGQDRGQDSGDGERAVARRSRKVDRKEKTPAEYARSFFNGEEVYTELRSQLIEKLPQQFVDRELDKFASYWTEPNKSGTKVRWETEKTFDVKRRIRTWLERATNYKKKNSGKYKATFI